jgi:uncharacterized protein
MELSRQAARDLLLYAQGLTTAPRSARKANVLRAIRRMQLLQIDTIHVVARSPYLVLFSRVGPYELRWFDELLAEGKLFEYWAHAMCFLPAEDYPLYASLIEHGLKHGFAWWRNAPQWLQQNAREAAHVRERIAQEGPLRSSDFVNTGSRRGPWWDWKVEKAALEYMFITGELMIARRDSFQRVYDLRERVQPGWNSAMALPKAQVHLQLVRQALQALGVATEPWLRDYYRLKQVTTQAALRELVAQGEVVEIRIEAVPGRAYALSSQLPLLRKAARGALRSVRSAYLSPFDPVVWDRRRGRELFDFDYTIEVYTPGPKRQYGYFTMPILHNGALIGRLDPKAHRKDGVFEVRGLHLEPGAKLDEADWRQLAAELSALAQWHSTPKIALAPGVAAGIARQLRRALKNIYT